MSDSTSFHPRSRMGRLWKTFHFACYLLVGLTLLFAANSASSQDEPDGDPEKKTQVTIRMKTLGGRQFWGDVRFFHGWKIQQNVLTGHFRLLDAKDFNHAWGTLETCEEKLKQVREELKLPKMSGHAVIMLHGIVRSSKSMSRMQLGLAESGFLPVPFDYPSTQANLEKCSEFLDEVIKSLDGVKEISFVTHSMGGLVVRNWLKEHEDKRVRRMVMIGTPNKGAEMADKLRDWKIYKLILGPAGQQLVSGDGSDASKLPVPKFEFAVIAGARGTADGYNPLILGDDDGTVGVRSAFLEGAADSELFPVLHSFLPVNPEVVKSTGRFLKTGSLRESGKREPVEAVPDTDTR